MYWVIYSMALTMCLISLSVVTLDFIFKKRFYLFIFREGKGGRKRGRETSMCGCLSGGAHWGPGPQPRHVPWLGIELATLWFPACVQLTEVHQPGLDFLFLRLCVSVFSRFFFFFFNKVFQEFVSFIDLFEIGSLSIYQFHFSFKCIDFCFCFYWFLSPAFWMFVFMSSWVEAIIESISFHFSSVLIKAL